MTRLGEAGARIAAAGGSSLAMLTMVVVAIKLMHPSDAAYFVPAALGAAAVLVAIVAGALQGARTPYLIFLSILLVGLSISFRVREAGAIGLDFQNAAKLVAWTAALGIGAWHLPRYRDLVSQPHIASMILYFLIAAASGLWSVVPLYSLANAIGLMGFCLFSLAGATLMPARTLITGCVASLGVYLAINLIAALVAPDFAFMAPSEEETVYRLSGVSGHANVLAQQISVLLGLLFICHDRKWLGRMTILALAAAALAALWLTNSRSSLFAVTVSLGLILLRRRPVLLILGILAAGLFGLSIFAIPTSLLDQVVQQFSRTGSASEILTLTGRTELWAFCLDKIMEQPLLGYGNMSGEEVISREYVSSSYGSTANAHNMILQSLLGVGIVGTSFVALIIVWHIWHFVWRPDPLRDVFGVMMICSGLTEIEIFGSMATVYALIYFCAIAAHAAESRERSARSGRHWFSLLSSRRGETSPA